ncbi:hypothetical protein LTS18_011781, partial [Coniosporium uncinatum]
MSVPGVRELSPRVIPGDIVCLRQLRIDSHGNPVHSIHTALPGALHHAALAPYWDGIQYDTVVVRVDLKSQRVFVEIKSLSPESMKFNVSFQVALTAYGELHEAVAMSGEGMRPSRRRPQVKSLPVHDKPASRAWSNNGPMPVVGVVSGPPMQSKHLAAAYSDSVTPPANGLDRFSTTTDGSGDTVHSHDRIHVQPAAKRTHSRPWSEKMLFPSESDGVLQHTLNSAMSHRACHDQKLNFEQCKAIESICKHNYGDIPYLISGPPGTGKTKTLVEIALQLIRHTSGVSHILVCAPSDPAADTLAQRLRHWLGPAKMLRLNAFQRTFAEVSGELLPYCYVQNDRFGIPPFRELMGFSIVVTTCRDAAMLVHAHVTNQDLHHLEESMLSALHPDRQQEKLKLHWDALLIDEAAQAIEPEALIPLTVICPPTTEDSVTRYPAFIMAGDQRQLGPRTSSRLPALERSLFERLFDRPLYAGHLLARHSLGRKRPHQTLTKAMLPIIRPPFANLIRNYRSHPAILAVPSALFYSDTLIPEAAHRDDLLSWPGWKGRGWP